MYRSLSPFPLPCVALTPVLFLPFPLFFTSHLIFFQVPFASLPYLTNYFSLILLPPSSRLIFFSLLFPFLSSFTTQPTSLFISFTSLIPNLKVDSRQWSPFFPPLTLFFPFPLQITYSSVLICTYQQCFPPHTDYFQHE